MIGEDTALVQLEVTGKNIAIMKKNKDMKRGNSYFQYGNNMVPVKWFVNRAVTMVGACLGECNKVSVPCPEIIKD